jgi:hypothetical protein
MPSELVTNLTPVHARIRKGDILVGVWKKIDGQRRFTAPLIEYAGFGYVDKLCNFMGYDETRRVKELRYEATRSKTEKGHYFFHTLADTSNSNRYSFRKGQLGPRSFCPQEQLWVEFRRGRIKRISKSDIILYSHFDCKFPRYFELLEELNRETIKRPGR